MTTILFTYQRGTIQVKQEEVIAEIKTWPDTASAGVLLPEKDGARALGYVRLKADADGLALIAKLQAMPEIVKAYVAPRRYPAT